MVMSNKERQARWRAKLKRMAASAPRLEDLLREHMRAFLLQQADRLTQLRGQDQVLLRRGGQLLLHAPAA